MKCNPRRHTWITPASIGGSLQTALNGDMIAKQATDNGWEGIIINGVVCDGPTLATFDLGLKAFGTNPRESRKEGAGERDVEVAFGDATFTPGCRLVSDADGIVVPP